MCLICLRYTFFIEVSIHIFCPCLNFVLLSYYWLQGVLYTFWIQVCFSYVICNVFFRLVGSLFFLLKVYFKIQMFLILINANLSTCVLWCIKVNLCLHEGHRIFLLCFLQKILHFLITFRSIVTIVNFE